MPHAVVVAVIALAVAGAASTALRPQAAAVGAVVAFASDRDGEYDLYAANADGTGLRRLTSSPGADQAPRPSPRGDTIAYVSSDARGIHLALVTLSNPRPRLVRGLGSLQGPPSWSPDGRLLAATVYSATSGDVAFVDTDGRIVRRATPTGCCSPGEPSWAPDSRRVVVPAGTTGSGIAVMDSRSGATLASADFEGINVASLAWSPDGEWIAVSMTADLGPNRLWLIRPDGTGRRSLLSEPMPLGTIAWLPDGEGLIVDGVAPGRRASEIHRIDARSGALRTLVRTLAGERIREPRLSPDGRSIAYVRERYVLPENTGGNLPGDFSGVAPGDVEVVALEGGRRLAATPPQPDGGTNDQPAWVTGTPRLSATPALPVVQGILGVGIGGALHLAADAGRTVVADVVPGRTCGRIATRSARTAPLIRHPDGCPRISSGLRAVAVAGDRVAWLRRERVGNGGDQTCLVIVRVAGTTRTPIARPGQRCFGGPAYTRALVYSPSGIVIDSLAGSGSTLAYVTHYTCFRVAGDETECDGKPLGDSERTLWLVTSGAPKRIPATNPAAILAVDGDRIVVADPRGRLEVVSTSGRRIAAYRPPGPASSAAIDDKRLYVLSDRRLDAVTLPGGRSVGTWPIVRGTGPPLRLAGVRSGLAVVSGGASIRLMRLTDGRTATLRLPRGGPPVHAVVSGDALVYSYHLPRATPAAQLVEVPLLTLLARLRRVP